MPRNKNKKKTAATPEVKRDLPPKSVTPPTPSSSNVPTPSTSTAGSAKRAKKRRKTNANRSDANSVTVKGTKVDAVVDSERPASVESDSNARASSSTNQGMSSSRLIESKEISTSETDLTVATASETEREADTEKSAILSEQPDSLACRSNERRKGKRRMSDRSASSDCNSTEKGNNAPAENSGDNHVVTDERLVPCSPTVKEHPRKDKGKQLLSTGSTNSAENGRSNNTNEQSLLREENSSMIAELERLKKELHHKNDMIYEMQKSSKKLRTGVSCLICLELMANPFTAACGHTTCYECLTDWLKQKGECPVCRVPIDKPPVLSFSMRDLAENVVDCMNSDDRAVQKQKMIEKIALLRGITDYFPGRFSRSVTIIDVEDEGTRRCSRCTWEVVGNVCTGCGEIFPELPSENEYPDYEEDDMYGEDYDDSDAYDSDFVVGDDAVEYDYAAAGLPDDYDQEMEMTFERAPGFEYDDEEEQYSDSDSDSYNYDLEPEYGNPPGWYSEGPFSSGPSGRGESSPPYYSDHEYTSNISDNDLHSYPDVEGHEGDEHGGSISFSSNQVTDEESERLRDPSPEDNTEPGQWSDVDESAEDDEIREEESDGEGDMIVNRSQRGEVVESDGSDYPEEEAGSELASEDEEEVPALRKRRRVHVNFDSDDDGGEDDEEEE